MQSHTQYDRRGQPELIPVSRQSQSLLTQKLNWPKNFNFAHLVPCTPVVCAPCKANTWLGPLALAVTTEKHIGANC